MSFCEQLKVLSDSIDSTLKDSMSIQKALDRFDLEKQHSSARTKIL